MSAYLYKEYSLRFHGQRETVPLVVEKLFKAQRLHGAHGAPVLPVDADLQLAGLRGKRKGTC